MAYASSHALAIGVGLFAVAVVLLGFALWHWLGTVRGGRRGPSPRPRRAGDVLVKPRGAIDDREFGSAAARPLRPRADLPPRPDLSWSQSRPPAPQPAVLGLENQIDGLQDTLVRRVDALERRIERLERQLDLEPRVDDLAWERSDRIDGPAARPGNGGGWDRGIGRGDGDAVISRPIVSGVGGGTGGGWDAAAGGVAVEIRGSEVVASQSYPPEAYLTVRGGGVATVVLNPEVPHNSFALDRFALFFDLGERRDGMYQTQTPAEVKWDGQRGTLSRAGRAVAR